MTNGNPVAEAGKWFAGSFALAGAVGGFVGLTGGDVDRILLNEGVLLLISVICLVFAVVLGALTPVWAGRESQQGRARLMLATAAALLVVGLVVLAVAASESTAENERPKVTASLENVDGTTVLSGTASASGVRNDEHVELRVWGRSASEPLDDQLLRTGHPRAARGEGKAAATAQSSQLLLGLRSGPDRDGNVDLPYKVPVAAGLYEQLEVYATLTSPKKPGRVVCNITDKELGCASIWVPQPATRPSLASAFAPKGVMKVKIDMAGAAADDLVAVRVRPVSATGLGAPIYSARLPADGAGGVTAMLEIPVPQAVKRVCVIARHLPTPKSVRVPAKGRCSPADVRTATTLLRRPQED